MGTRYKAKENVYFIMGENHGVTSDGDLFLTDDDLTYPTYEKGDIIEVIEEEGGWIIWSGPDDGTGNNKQNFSEDMDIDSLLSMSFTKL